MRTNKLNVLVFCSFVIFGQAIHTEKRVTATPQVAALNLRQRHEVEVVQDEAERYELRKTSEKRQTGPSVIPDVSPRVQEMFKENPEKKKRLMDAINKFRAEVCAQMHKDHEDFASEEACKKFMEDACRPGKDGMMDGDKKERSSGEGFCREYFPVSEEKAVDEIEKEDKDDAVVVEEVGGAAGANPKGGKVVPVGGAPAPAGAPAAGPAGSLGPAPGPAYPPDEAWYYKDGGISPDRFHMREENKLPTQGYWGKLVEHDDMKTSADDWQSEFDAHSRKNLDRICAHYRNNEWCREKGYGAPHHHSGATPRTPIGLAGLGSSILISILVCIVAEQ